MTVQYIIKLKLLSFRRKFLPKSRFIDFIFTRFEKYSLKSIKKIKEDLEIENFPADLISAPYLISRGKYERNLFLLLLLLFSIFVDVFPFFFSDFVIDWFSFFWTNPLLFVVAYPLIVCVCLSVIPKSNFGLLANVSIYSGFLLLLFLLTLFARFDLSADDFQFQFRLFWEPDDVIPFFECIFGLDGFSLSLILLTAFIFLLCFLLANSSVNNYLKEYYILLYVLLFFVLASFLALDVVFFYIFFEATLVPLFLLIILFGTRERKVLAAYKLFFYTLVSSVCTLIGLITILLSIGSGDLYYAFNSFFSPFWQKFIWFLLFLSFAAKLPMIPIHLWLPEAHVEAPTGGSVILASILLKLGGYGFFRFLLPLCPEANLFFSPLLVLLSCFAIIYASLVALRQVDLKKLVAYSSIAHMGFISLSIAFFNTFSYSGGVLILLSHGFISGALFFCVGVLYDRYKTRLLFYFKSLTTTMPLFSAFFFFFVLANIGLPSTMAFVGELMALIGVFDTSVLAAFFAGLGIIFGAAYSLWMFNRICFGSVSTKYISFYLDLSLIELSVLFLLFVPTLFFGLFPTTVIEYLNFFVENLNSLLYFKI